jgi:hypothetical protein
MVCTTERLLHQIVMGGKGLWKNLLMRSRRVARESKPFAKIRIHGSAECWSAAMKELVGGWVVARTQPKLPWESRTDPSLTARGDVEVRR